MRMPSPRYLDAPDADVKRLRDAYLRACERVGQRARDERLTRRSR